MDSRRTRVLDTAFGRFGVRAWLVLGIALLIGVLFVALASVSGLVVPLVIATVIGILFVPMVDVLGRYLPRKVASGLVLVLLSALGVMTVAMTIGGIVDQRPQIQAQITNGLAALADWIADAGWELGEPADLVERLGEVLSAFVPGLASVLTSVFSSVAAFAIGTFSALFMLYFILSDWDSLSGWVGRHLGVPHELGKAMVNDTVWSMRQYFYVLTGTAVVTAVLIGVTMSALGLPLAFTVAVVTLITSYVPYIGALFSGTFAFLIALGSGGATDAFIVLAVVLVVQNVVQPVMQAKFTESALKLHPIVTFGSTIVGAAIAGILGAALSAPIVAIGVSFTNRLQRYWSTQKDQN